MFALEIVTVALGAARGAIDDLLAVADRVPMLEHDPLAANRYFQHGLGDADTALRAARCLVRECADALWELAERGASPSGELVARTRAAAAWSAATAVDTVTTAYRLAGGSALYDESPLQRRLRDVNTIAQHFLVKPDTLTTAGRVLSGQEPGIPVF
jgi:alkylation response protein AidB-like acyl-CoA dehydrogenase